MTEYFPFMALVCSLTTRADDKKARVVQHHKKFFTLSLIKLQIAAFLMIWILFFNLLSLVVFSHAGQ